MVVESARVLVDGKGLSRSVAIEWRELGALGRVALVGVVLSAGLAVVLGFSISAAARGHLLAARADLIEVVASDLVARGMVPTGRPADPAVLEALDEAVERRLLGGETVRVKVWDPDGVIVYSDASQLIGRTFPLGEGARRAFATGETAVGIPDLSAPENVYERNLGTLIEYYVPVQDSSGTPVALFEVYQRADALEGALAGIRRNVWVSIGSGLGILGLFMGALTVSTARVLNRRRRQAEGLLGSLLRAQDEERRRIVGALHDDVGQPLYRLLYGLQGSRARLPQGSEVTEELGRLTDLVREVDRTLRGELRLLHRGLAEDLGLERGLSELVEATRRETGLRVELSVEETPEVDPTTRSALLRAAQEALLNVRKHAGAKAASVRLERRGARVVLEVSDDGRGWRGQQGLGLITTRERLEAIGGGLRIGPGNGRGTVVRAWVPTGRPPP